MTAASCLLAPGSHLCDPRLIAARGGRRAFSVASWRTGRQCGSVGPYTRVRECARATSLEAGGLRRVLTARTRCQPAPAWAGGDGCAVSLSPAGSLRRSLLIPSNLEATASRWGLGVRTLRRHGMAGLGVRTRGAPRLCLCSAPQFRGARSHADPSGLCARSGELCAVSGGFPSAPLEVRKGALARRFSHPPFRGLVGGTLLASRVAVSLRLTAEETGSGRGLSGCTGHAGSCQDERPICPGPSPSIRADRDPPGNARLGVAGTCAAAP